MKISATMVKKLRDKTNAGMLDCKNALADSDGDFDKAVELLRLKGLATAQKRAGRATSQGLVHAYIHAGGKLGVLVEVNCETDFVARNESFAEFVNDIAMQIAATNPICVNKDELPQEIVDKERALYRQQALDSGKPEKIVDKIVDGKMKKYVSEVCLMDQASVKDTDKTITDVLNECIASIGENIGIRRFTRYVLGEELE